MTDLAGMLKINESAGLKQICGAGGDWAATKVPLLFSFGGQAYASPTGAAFSGCAALLDKSSLPPDEHANQTP